MPETKTVKVGLLAYIAAFILLLLIAVAFALPITYFLMLFAGNVGVDLSFWGALPGGIVLSFIKTRVNNKQGQ